MSTAAMPNPFDGLMAALEAIQAQLVEIQAQPAPSVQSPWLDVDGAADYLGMTPAAVRAAVRREQIPYERTPLGQLRFERAALDAWVRRES